MLRQTTLKSKFIALTAASFLCLIPFAVAQEKAAEQVPVYNDNGKRDPFWPLVSASGTIITYDSDIAVSEMVLEGIIAGGSEKMAIINGRIVKVNDAIGMFTIVDIQDNQVVLQKGEEKFILNLNKGGQ